MTINEVGNQLSLYEIYFKEATVTLDYTESVAIAL